MNRLDELNALQTQLEHAPAMLDSTLERAELRLERHRMRVRRSLSRGACSAAAVFVLFVALVNFCMPVAYACSNVPLLRELAEAVTFSRSLSDAVENEYVQPVDLTQTDNGVTARVEYLIVDQKQVHVFFRLESEDYEMLDVHGHFLPEEGGRFTGGISFGANDHRVPVGTLQSVSLDLFDDNTPGKIRISLEAYDSSLPAQPADRADDTPSDRYELMVEDRESRQEYVAQFAFLLEFDPDFVTQGVIYPIDKEVDIGGQTLIIRQLEVYPTHMRILTCDHPDNTAWIRFVRFTVQGDWGITFDKEATGLNAYGRNDQFVYLLQSPWFYRCKELNLCVSEATLVEKDNSRVMLDLTTGESDRPLPGGYQFWDADRYDNGWTLTIRGPRWSEDRNYQMLAGEYFDEKGESYTIQSYSPDADGVPADGWEDWQYETVGLKGYQQDTVWLDLMVSRLWQTESPLVVPVK